MDIQSLYEAFIVASKQPCGRGDPQREAKLCQYRMAKQQLFDALRDEYEAGKLRSEKANHIAQVISESTQNPEAFWGSAKVAKKNQSIFVYEKNDHLFEELLQCWLERGDIHDNPELLEGGGNNG